MLSVGGPSEHAKFFHGSVEPTWEVERPLRVATLEHGHGRENPDVLDLELGTALKSKDKTSRDDFGGGIVIPARSRA